MTNLSIHHLITTIWLIILTVMIYKMKHILHEFMTIFQEYIKMQEEKLENRK